MRRIFVNLLLASALALSAFAQNAPPVFVIDTVAGRFDLGDGSPADRALLASPQGLAQDANGNIYIADRLHYRVRKITPQGTISTVAGNGSFGFGGDGGPALEAMLTIPYDVAVDADGNVYIADASNNRIRRVDAATGIITTVAGGGTALGDGGPATQAMISFCRAVDIDGGNLYIADYLNQRIRRVNAAGVISTIAGTGTAGFSGDNGPATAAQLSGPSDVVVAPPGSPMAGAILIADAINNRVRIIRQGTIDTLAGTGTSGLGGNGGPADAAQLSLPTAVAADTAGNVFIVDTVNQRVRQVAPNGTISTIVGNGFGFSGDGGPATAALLDTPGGVLVTPQGRLYVSDTENNRLRSVVNGVISTAAGRNRATGDGGPALNAEMFFPFGIDVDRDDNVIVTDFRNHRIRKITFASPGTMSTVAGSNLRGSLGDGGPATAATLNYPNDSAADSQGNVYIVETPSNRIRKVSPSGTISTFAGTGVGGFSGDGGPATEAQIMFPNGVDIDVAGRVYITDGGNHRIRRVDADGTIRTIAGTGQPGVSGDGGPATSATFTLPARIHVDSQGYIFFASGADQRIRAITPNGTMQTVVGTGAAEFNGDGLPALETNINGPTDMAVDANQNLFFVENSGQKIRMAPLAPVAALGGPVDQVVAGNVVTVAGTGAAGFSGDRGLATDARLNGPLGLAIDSQGRIYVSDSANHRVRVLDPTLPLATTAGVVNAASFAKLLAPGMIGTAFVVNGAEQDASAASVPLPTNLGGVTVEIRDSQGVTRPSGILGIFNGRRQINFVIDAATAVGPATLTLRRADSATSSAAIQIAQVAPGVFFGANAQSQPVALANVLHFRGADLTVTNTFTPSLELDPIDLGPEGDQVYVSLYATGIQFASSVANMSATIGGDTVPVFSFAGSLEQYVGLGQVNVGPIPRSFAGRGPGLLVLSVDGVAANGVMVSFR